MIEFFVPGVPVPQGSHRGFVVNGRAVITQDNKRTKPWRQAIIHTALDAIEQASAPAGTFPLTGPIALTVTFVMPRPKFHFGSGRNAQVLKPNAPAWVDKKPDVDKLVRALGDACTEAGVWRDDAQVAALAVRHLYADPGRPTGAHVAVEPLTVGDTPPAPAAVPSVQERLL